MMLAGLGRACRAGSGRCEAQPPDRSQYVGGGGGVSSGADEQRAVGLATGARKHRAGLGAQVRDHLGGVGQFEREHVPGEAVTPGERQAMGRRASRTSKPARGWVPSSLAMGLPSGMRRDVAV
jgi:hypothetical protein